MDVDSYLKRFYADRKSNVDLSYLAYLQRQHMLHIPFENLDVINQIPITLNKERFFNKIVNYRRGGFCYELNGLFLWLLQQLGYQAHLICATVLKTDGTWALTNSHSTIIVHLDQPYLVDVGFGDSTRHPLLILGSEEEDVSGKYRVIDSGHNERSTYLYQKEKNSKWQTLYCFNLKKKELSEFAPMCHYNQTSPHSEFTKKSLVTIATENGRVTLSGDVLTITDGNMKTSKEITNRNIEEVLKKYFWISQSSCPPYSVY